jgi:hypothetical protein
LWGSDGTRARVLLLESSSNQLAAFIALGAAVNQAFALKEVDRFRVIRRNNLIICAMLTDTIDLD